jgi:hypothetical protein
VAPNTHVPAEQLEADIRDGTIDTVVVAFVDHHGRLIGKRTDAGFCYNILQTTKEEDLIGRIRRGSAAPGSRSSSPRVRPGAAGTSST